MCVYLKPTTPCKKTLILDLDETLVHSDMDFKYKGHDVILKLKKNSEDMIIPLFIRPGLEEFLTYARDNYPVHLPL
jgi:TFIIF-interacting CTD phosphatase-like protein